MATCSKCDAPAVTAVRYAGVHLCRSHFMRFVERRVKAEVRDQVDLDEHARIGVAVSGGKDSATVAAILADIVGPRPKPELVAIAVDEGIPGYRDVSLDACREAMDLIGIQLHVTSHREVVGLTTDEAASADPDTPPCTYCGPWRRAAINHAARELGCDLVATGHNLDDTAQTVLMSLLGGDLGSLARMAPHAGNAVEGLVPRLTPLRTIPEREVALYAHLRGLPVDTAECPHAVRAARGRYRDVLLELTDDEPTLRHSLLSTADRLKPLLRNGLELEAPAACGECGQPAAASTNGAEALCRSCALAARVRAQL